MKAIFSALAFALASIGSASADPNPLIPSASGPAPFSSTEIHFRSYGAAGNDVADDTAAINAAFAAARAAVAVGSAGVEVICDPGVYKTTGSINATGLATFPMTRPVVFSGAGCLIDAHFSGAPIIDALGDTAVTFRDFALYGDVPSNPASFIATISGTVLSVSAISSGALSVGMHVEGVGVTPGTIVTATGTGTGGVGTYTISVSSTIATAEAMTSYSGPTTGIQIGRLSTANADRNAMEDITISGDFTIAACYNLASEIVHWNHVRCYNSSADPQSYGAIWDGINHFSIHSPFQVQTLPANTATFLSDNVCTDCDFMSNAGGPTIWLAQVGGIFFNGGYIFNQNAQPAVALYTGIGTLENIHFKIHMEIGTIPENFFITGTSAAPTIEGFEYEDQDNFAATSLIALDGSSGVTSATIRDLTVSIGDFVSNVSATVFDNPASYTVFGGNIHLPSPTNWNAPASFSGIIFTSGTTPSGAGATLNYGGGANVVTGQNATVCGGAQNAASGSGAIACGVADTADGSFDVSLGNGALTRGRLGVMCYGSSNGTPGQTQSCSGQMQGSGTTPMQLTANAATANGSNEFNIAVNETTFGLGLRISCRDITAPGNDVSVLWNNLMLSRDAGVSTTTLTAASKTTPDYSQTRGSAAFSWALAADTTNAGLSITALPPNSDLWHCGAQVLPSIEIQ